MLFLPLFVIDLISIFKTISTIKWFCSQNSRPKNDDPMRLTTQKVSIEIEDRHKIRKFRIRAMNPNGRALNLKKLKLHTCGEIMTGGGPEDPIDLRFARGLFALTN